MENILINYILFIIKSITIITIIIILLLLIMFIILISIYNNNTTYVIKNINNYYKNKQLFLIKKIYNKTEVKKITKVLKKTYNNTRQSSNKNIFIIDLNTDIQFKLNKKLQEIISLIILTAKKNDSVFIKLNSSGGLVNHFGLAASQLIRLKNNNISLIISVDLIAASGGYMMASVANKIIASKFAIIGSIGVLGIIPNFNQILKKHNINIEYHTSGNYKSTLNLIGENTSYGRKKFITSLHATHILFKNFIKNHRKNININKISTGEYWYAIDAIKLNLIDEIITSEEYIIKNLSTCNIYEININQTSMLTTINHKIYNIL